MSATNAVMDCTNRQVKRIIFIVACPDGNRGLVAAKNDRYEHGAMSFRVPRNQILDNYFKIGNE